MEQQDWPCSLVGWRRRRSCCISSLYIHILQRDCMYEEACTHAQRQNHQVSVRVRHAWGGLGGILLGWDRSRRQQGSVRLCFPPEEERKRIGRGGFRRERPNPQNGDACSSRFGGVLVVLEEESGQEVKRVHIACQVSKGKSSPGNVSWGRDWALQPAPSSN